MLCKLDLVILAVQLPLSADPLDQLVLEEEIDARQSLGRARSDKPIAQRDTLFQRQILPIVAETEYSIIALFEAASLPPEKIYVSQAHQCPFPFRLAPGMR